MLGLNVLAFYWPIHSVLLAYLVSMAPWESIHNCPSYEHIRDGTEATLMNQNLVNLQVYIMVFI